MAEINIGELRKELLGETPVNFSYLKADGSLRPALGTLNESLIPEDKKPKDSSANYANSFRYYDLEREAWRSLSQDCSVVTIIK